MLLDVVSFLSRIHGEASIEIITPDRVKRTGEFEIAWTGFVEIVLKVRLIKEKGVSRSNESSIKRDISILISLGLVKRASPSDKSGPGG